MVQEVSGFDTLLFSEFFLRCYFSAYYLTGTFVA